VFCLSCDHSHRFENHRIDECPKELVQGIYGRHFIQRLASEQYIGTVSANKSHGGTSIPGTKWFGDVGVRFRIAEYEEKGLTKIVDDEHAGERRGEWWSRLEGMNECHCLKSRGHDRESITVSECSHHRTSEYIEQLKQPCSFSEPRHENPLFMIRPAFYLGPSSGGGPRYSDISYRGHGYLSISSESFSLTWSVLLPNIWRPQYIGSHTALDSDNPLSRKLILIPTKLEVMSVMCNSAKTNLTH
jgi:hypothetical protein